MKTRKKLVSILCAATLLVSALPAASAVSAEPLSEYAGKTIPVQVVKNTKDGLTSHIVEVAVPPNTTKTEERTLINAVALGKKVSARDADFIDTFLGQKDDVQVTGVSQEVIRKTLPRALDEVVVNFELTSINHPGECLLLEVANKTTDTSTGYHIIHVMDGIRRVVFAETEETGLVPTAKGQTLSVNVETLSATGSIGLSTIFAYGYTYY